MVTLLARRILISIPVLLLVSIGVFSLVQLIPGDAAQALAGPDASPAEIAAVRADLGLDRPLWDQYFSWLTNLLHLDFGTSLMTKSSIVDELSTRFPVTLQITLAAAVISLLIGVPFGLLAGIQPGGRFDQVARVVASMAAAIPNFWLGPLLLLTLAVQSSLLPSSGFVSFSDSPIGYFTHVLLPAMTLGLHVAAMVMRQLRAQLVDVLDSNYVRTMWAQGISARVIMLKHALRNAAGPAVTIFGLQLSALLGGSVIIEQIFGIQGVGTYVLGAIVGRDVPVIQAVAVLFAVAQLTLTLVVDVCYAALNPKVRVH